MLELPGIPFVALPDTLKAQGMGSSRAIGVTSELIVPSPEDPIPDDELPSRDERIQDGLRTLRVEHDRLAAFEAVFSRTASQQLLNAKVDSALWAKTLDSFLERRRALERQKTELEEEQYRLEQTAKSHSGAAPAKNPGTRRRP